MKSLLLLTAGIVCWGLGGLNTVSGQERPNILFCIADDWSWPHAGAYGDTVVQTPVFDRLAREGILFHQAFVSAPSCTSSRAAILTGQWHWRLQESANLWSTLRQEYQVYPDLLERAGYAVGYSGKGWGPGKIEPGGRTANPAGHRFKDFETFCDSLQPGQPFCFWFGSTDPHRPYDAGAGKESGITIDPIQVPQCLPNAPAVRADIADYYHEVQRFDRDVGRMLDLLEARGALDNTFVVMTSDNGMPFPRCKSHLYDMGTRMPLAIRWPKQIPPGRSNRDLVSLTDLAPTFLEAAGVAVPRAMTGRSLMGILQSAASGRIEHDRVFVLMGKERHCPAQETPDMGGYPSRALRSIEFLYIRNYRPDRWPSGTSDHERATIKNAWLADTDNGPTKSYMVDHRDQDARHRRLYDLSFGKRPAEELYDLKTDPHQLANRAAQSEYRFVLAQLRAQLTEALRNSGDPRELGSAEVLETYPYYGGAPKFPGTQ